MSTPSTPSTNANIPGGAPLVDESRQIEQVWYQFLLALFNRTGGAGTPTDITGLTKQVTAQDVEINSFVPVPQRPAQGTEPFVAIPPPANAITYRPISNIFRSVESKLRDVVSLTDFGAKIDGVTDDTAAVNAALASGAKAVYFPYGDCVVSALNVTVNNSKLIGSGRRQSRFLVQSANLPAISVTGGLTGVELSNFSISRQAVAVSGGDGIQWLASNSQGLISNILVENCWRGFALGPTDYAKVIQCIAQQNYSYGFHITNVGVGGACQWSLDQCLSQTNNNHGMFIDSSTGTSGGLSLGEISQFSTFANAGKGIVAIGSAANPINGLRILGGFAGQDADDELYLDTFGGQHKIIGIELELAGTTATGRSLTIPASNIGHGMSVTANNGRVQISDPNINGCSASGIATFASVVSISNPHITNNGLAPIVSDRNGVLAGAGRTSIVGGYIADTGSASQQFGVSIASGAFANLTGVDLTGNVSAPYTGAGLTIANVVNCFPNIASTAYTPVVTATTGTFTTASAIGSYYIVGKTVYFELAVTITTVGTASGNVLATLPFTTNVSAGVQTFNGVERAITGKTLQGFVSANTNSMTIRNYDTTTVIAAGTLLVMSGSFLAN